MSYDYDAGVDQVRERASVQEIVADVLKGAGISPEPPRPAVPAAPAASPERPKRMVEQVIAMRPPRA